MCLQAWLSAPARPPNAYWQGVDSVCAPFVVLFFDCEELAWACLDRMVQRHLRDLFVADSNAHFSLSHRMRTLTQLLCFHDPVLASHLADIHFHPELYAVPWFLTLFAHILPLDQLYTLWDTLLLLPPPFVLCVALALLCDPRTRGQLLALDFNGCIMFFSNLLNISVNSQRDIQIERCVAHALSLYAQTPLSFYTPEDKATTEAIANTTLALNEAVSDAYAVCCMLSPH